LRQAAEKKYAEEQYQNGCEVQGIKAWKEAIIMAHASCPNGHGMWNGDGKPVVWAFRVGYFRDFMKRHPDCKLDEDSEYW